MEVARVLVFAFLMLWVFGKGGGGEEVVMSLEPCNFPAIYNFGDSNSDTGGLSAAFIRIPLPYGETFFQGPSGRFSDGRLIIDLMVEKLGLPFLNAYLDSIESNFRYGSNFASGGSTICPMNGTLFLELRFFPFIVGPFFLISQLWQFEQFRARTSELYNQAKSRSDLSRLPIPEDFSKALYTIDIGQNDLYAGFLLMTDDELEASIPSILDPISFVVQRLYEQGARTFWVHNTGPLGCLPSSIIFLKPSKPGVDKYGCLNSPNNIAKKFNEQLKERVIELRAQFPSAALTYVDIYTAKYELISNAKQLGFVDPRKICILNLLGGYDVLHGPKTNINGTDNSCTDPSTYISWDGVHYTEAANKLIANRILNGSLSDPPIPISNACYISKH